jgi:hypothetical protein
MVAHMGEAFDEIKVHSEHSRLVVPERPVEPSTGAGLEPLDVNARGSAAGDNRNDQEVPADCPIPIRIHSLKCRQGQRTAACKREILRCGPGGEGSKEEDGSAQDEIQVLHG